MSYTLTITIHLWWLFAYLGIGAALLPLLAWLAERHMQHPRPLWRVLLRPVHWYYPLVIIPLWPVAVWEEVR